MQGGIKRVVPSTVKTIYVGPPCTADKMIWCLTGACLRDPITQNRGALALGKTPNAILPHCTRAHVGQARKGFCDALSLQRPSKSGEARALNKDSRPRPARQKQ
eukprot:15472957-Alexandrium_andersonii.AAC.1